MNHEKNQANHENNQGESVRMLAGPATSLCLELDKPSEQEHDNAYVTVNVESPRSDQKAWTTKCFGFLWRLAKLFLAIWLIVDMILDALQLFKYRRLSPGLRLDHEANGPLQALLIEKNLPR